MGGPMSSAFYIAGAHTDVGKTYVACALLRAARARGLTVDAFKPVVSGIDPDDWADSDPARLLDAMGRERTQAALEAISPWRFGAPLSPPMAAKLEGRQLPLGPVIEAAQAFLTSSKADLALLESVGGVMSPIADRATGLELMLAAPLPVILVGGGYLGGISHSLTALEVLRQRGLPVAAFVISQVEAADAPDFAETVALTRSFSGDTPVISAPRGAPGSWPEALLGAVSAKA